MGNCLVTKLKSSVSNPDLPVFETMQQFTLDAITASGNSSMTDAQKWALNHFFYQIGAIHQNGIWNKINVLLLPMLATPASGYNAYMVHDYKANLAAIDSNADLTGENGGLECLNSAAYILNTPSTFVNPNAASIIAMETAGHSISESILNRIKYIYNDNSNFKLGLDRSQSYFIGAVTSGLQVNMRIPIDNPIILYSINIKGTPWDNTTLDYFAYNVNGEKVSRANKIYPDSNAFIDHTGATVSETAMELAPGHVLGLFMSFTDTLTDAESTQICEAAIALRSAFEVI